MGQPSVMCWQKIGSSQAELLHLSGEGNDDHMHMSLVMTKE